MLPLYEPYSEKLIQYSTDILAIVSVDGELVYCNAAAKPLLGYAPSYLVGQTIQQFLHQEDTRTFEQFLFRTLAEEQAQTPDVVRFAHRLGHWVYLELQGNVLLGDQGPQLVLNGRDVSQRMEAERRIREQAAILEHVQDAITVMNLQSRITYWSKRATELYGWREDEVRYQDAYDLLHRADTDEFIQAQAAVIEDGTWSGILRQLRQDGTELLVESRWTLIHDADGQAKAIVTVNTDITERKKLETQLLRSQRMESLGTLAGGMAHDLNNIFGPILLALEVLGTRVTGEVERKMLQTLESCTKRGAGLIRQVLSFARGADGERIVLQLSYLLDELEHILADTLPRSVQLQTNIPSDLWLMQGDATLLQQVFMNLCVNARDAMPNGGLLKIEASNHIVSEHFAKQHVGVESGVYVRVRVSDTGCGMPPQVLDKIFEPFFSTKENGTGLGLATTIGIIKGHDGFIDVFSEVGGGSRFDVYFPAQEGDAIVSEPVVPANSRLEGNGETILVVDDEASMRALMQTVLESHQYKVLTAVDGAHGIAAFVEYSADIDLVITDLMMPRMDGNALVASLRQIRPEVPIVAVSGLVQDRNVLPDTEEAIQVFLKKPFDAHELLAALKEVLAEAV